MTTPRGEFKRIVVALPHQSPDESTRLAAEVAALLGLELLGLFVQEESLIELAALPFAREFRPLDGWHPIEIERLLHELDLAATNAQRLFARAVAGLEMASQFEVVRGSIAQIIGSLSRLGDIVIVPEPTGAADRAIRDLGPILEAAFQSGSAVMLVPPKIARWSGAVVAIAADPHDPSIRAAAAIATSAQESLVILCDSQGGDRADVAEASQKPATTVKPIPGLAKQLSHAAGIAAALRGVRERLVVMSRGALAEAAAKIASVRHDPILIVND